VDSERNDQFINTNKEKAKKMSTLKNTIANNTKYNLLANQLVFAPKYITNRAIITYLFAMIGWIIASLI
jgi:ribosomal protein L17